MLVPVQAAMPPRQLPPKYAQARQAGAQLKG
jgi:hypothetical protein